MRFELTIRILGGNDNTKQNAIGLLKYTGNVQTREEFLFVITWSYCALTTTYLM